MVGIGSTCCQEELASSPRKTTPAERARASAATRLKTASAVSTVCGETCKSENVTHDDTEKKAASDGGVPKPGSGCAAVPAAGASRGAGARDSGATVERVLRRRRCVSVAGSALLLVALEVKMRCVVVSLASHSDQRAPREARCAAASHAVLAATPLPLAAPPQADAVIRNASSNKFRSSRCLSSLLRAAQYRPWGDHHGAGRTT